MADSLQAFKSENTQHISSFNDVEALWEFEVPFSAEKVWPLVADTSRFNRAVGLGLRSEAEVDGRLLVTDLVVGVEQQWWESQWTWLASRMLSIHREYIKGNCHSSNVLIRLAPTPKGCKVVFYYGFHTKGLFWNVVYKLGLKRIRRKIAKLFQQFEASQANSAEVFNRPYSCDRAILDRVREIGRALVKDSNDPHCVDRLTDHICFGDELNLQQIRIKELAQKWKIPWEPLLRTALFACKHELLTVSWDAICPHCRGVRQQSSELSGVRSQVRCDPCQTDFTVFDEDSLEVSFHVHPDIREIPMGTYCVSQITRKPHIVFQKRLMPDQQFNHVFRLEPGTYRLREVGGPKEHLVEVSESASIAKVKIDLHQGPTHHLVQPNFELFIQQETNRDSQLVFENLLADQNVLRPRDIFGHPEFRRLFPKERLSTGLRLNLGTQVILFTDIVGSTQFYERAGDALAFAKVREHFNEVEEIIRQCRGVLVKTLGDSVMAAFSDTETALRAACRMQSAFSEERDDTPIRIRIVIHKGPVIAVNYNTGIDYFGTTVNMAAKMQSLVGAGEIGLSKACLREVLGIAAAQPERNELLRVGSQALELSVIKISENNKLRIAS